MGSKLFIELIQQQTLCALKHNAVIFVYDIIIRHCAIPHHLIDLQNPVVDHIFTEDHIQIRKRNRRYAEIF